MDTKAALEILGRQNYRQVTKRVSEAVHDLADRVAGAMLDHDLFNLDVPEYGTLSASKCYYHGACDEIRNVWLSLCHNSGNLCLSDNRFTGTPYCYDTAADRQEILLFALASDRILRSLDEAIRQQESKAASAEQALGAALACQ